MIDNVSARDEINDQFLKHWSEHAPSFNGGAVPPIEWQGVQPLSVPDRNGIWARVSIQNVMEQQTTLSTCEGVAGQRRYTASGLVFVQIFAPVSASSAFRSGLQLANVAKDAFRGKTTNGRIWFRNVRLNELEPEGAYYRFNVIAEFEHDEIA